MSAGLETFAKVRTLHDRTDSPGEKAAAAARMEALARSAGMTVEEAVSRLDAPAQPSPGGTFADFFDTPYFREQMAERNRERDARWREVLAEYGSEEAVFARTDRERTLSDAVERFRVRLPTTGWRIGSLLGWDAFSLDDPAPEIVEAIRTAYPMPSTVREAWDEFRSWDKIGRDREACGTGCGDHAPEVQFRALLVERLLDTMPALSLSDMRARMDWLDWRNEMENAPDPKEERIRLATLRADIERMGARLREHGAAPVQSGQVRPSRAERRAAVLALLVDGLGDREIARRLGISPTTVGTIRKNARGDGP